MRALERLMGLTEALPTEPQGQGEGPGRGTGGGRAHLVVFAVGVAAAAVRQDAALAVEHVARVALAALHAVVVAVALEADGGAARLAHAHAALVVAVGRAGDGCNEGQGRARQSGTASLPGSPSGTWRARGEESARDRLSP